MNRPVTPVSILLVEDNPQDVEIAKKALKRGGIRNELIVARDGQEALDIVFRAKNGNAPLPGLILLDLNLPKVNGHEVLKKLKDDPKTRRIPVILLTASSRESDVVRGYDDGANTYIPKPVEFDDFVKVLMSIQEYWLAIARLPLTNGAR